jgi:hypothetical protein
MAELSRPTLAADLARHRAELRARRLEIVVSMLQARLAIRGPSRRGGLERVVRELSRDLETSRPSLDRRQLG